MRQTRRHSTVNTLVKTLIDSQADEDEMNDQWCLEKILIYRANVTDFVASDARSGSPEL